MESDTDFGRAAVELTSYQRGSAANLRRAPAALDLPGISVSR
jgi:hypothetical protein